MYRLSCVLVAACGISFTDQGWNLGSCIGSTENQLLDYREVLKIDFNFNPRLPTVSGRVPSFAEDHVRTFRGEFTLRLSKSGPHSVWVPPCMGSLQGPALEFFFNS